MDFHVYDKKFSESLSKKPPQVVNTIQEQPKVNEPATAVIDAGELISALKDHLSSLTAMIVDKPKEPIKNQNYSAIINRNKSGEIQSFSVNGKSAVIERSKAGKMKSISINNQRFTIERDSEGKMKSIKSN